ncbi:MAG: family hydrolase [Deferribacteraceae bacterium]|jgi:HAD superfamily hydrolase (TIGR01450 family)|nr:family hydrolase [Deferribacteraceae bacterium]
MRYALKVKVIYILTDSNAGLTSILKGKPKSLLRVNGKFLIQRQIEEYLKLGIPEQDITVLTSSGIEIIKDAVSNTLNINIKDSKLKDCLKDIHDDFVIIQNDRHLITSDDLKNIFDAKTSVYSKNIDFYYFYKEDVFKLEAQDIDDIFNMLSKERISGWCNIQLVNVNGHPIENEEDLYELEKSLSEFTLKGKKAFIFDLDGTVYLGDLPIENTINFIVSNYQKFKFYFMTNNTSKNLTEYIKRLNNFGIPATIDRIISPLIPLIDYLKEKNITKIYPVANTSMKNYLKERMPEIIFTDDEKECEAVVLGFDTELTYEKMKTAALLLKDRKIRYLATHSDNVCPTDKGDIPDVGSFIALFEKTVNRTPEIVFGKPNKILLEPILRLYKENELAVFGDRVYTDKVLANNAGIDFVLVLSGEATRADVEGLERFPELIIKDCGELKYFGN